jgi:hypothetical protein
MASTTFTEDLDDLKAMMGAVLVNRAMKHVGN